MQVKMVLNLAKEIWVLNWVFSGFMMSVLKQKAVSFAMYMNVYFMLHANVKCKDPIGHFVKIKMTNELYYINLEIQCKV